VLTPRRPSAASRPRSIAAAAALDRTIAGMRIGTWGHGAPPHGRRLYVPAVAAARAAAAAAASAPAPLVVESYTRLETQPMHGWFSGQDPATAGWFSGPSHAGWVLRTSPRRLGLTGRPSLDGQVLGPSHAG
jgi:hypothetical protein